MGQESLLTFGHLVVWYLNTFPSVPFAHTDCANIQVFELAVGRELFEYTAYEKHGLDAPAGHLWQMMCFTGERFTPEQLQASDLAAQYFDSTCPSCPLDYPSFRSVHSHIES